MSNRIDGDDPFAVIEGRRDGLLKIFDAGNGDLVYEMVLESPPVWDGMAAANGRLYLCLENGKVLCLSGNIPPIVNAGEDQTIYPMAEALLDADASDDGLPFGSLTTNWSKFAGPGEVDFADTNAVDTAASFSQSGSYTLRLTAFDGGASSYDDINVIVCRPGYLDCDNDVDIHDLEQLTVQWLHSGCDDSNHWCDGADQAASGSVNLPDYSVLVLNWLLGVAPACPTNLLAIAGDSQVSLDWDDNTEADLAGYDVYRSTTSGSDYGQMDSGITVSTYMDNTVTNDTTYYYVVKAVDDDGYESGYSNEASATPNTGANSGVIVWSGPFNTSVPSDVETSGTMHEAINAVDDGRIGQTNTVNGVTFTGASLLPNSANVDTLVGATTGDADYDALLGTIDYGGGTSTTITIGDGTITPGAGYTVQVWFTDLRYDPPRIMTYGDGLGNTVDVACNAAGDEDFGQYAVGTFTADAGGSQTLSLTTNGFGNAHITAYQLRTHPGS